MSTEISLYGITREVLPGHGMPTPLIGAEISEVGLSNMRHDLDHFAEKFPEVLYKHKEGPQPGLDQYLVADPDTFVEHVEDNPDWWDSPGFGWSAAIEALKQDLAEGHQLVWWFIARS